MTDGPFPDRLSQLRARWEADPSSRIFLQLAEEYRHLGRVQEALAVLEKGLQEHPGYLSALVAKGRCLLELGDAPGARAVLERVVQQDATQMVANKLLVRAYLETGEAGKARERLDLYSLLNDGDPETEDLRRRVKDLERAAQALPQPFPLPPDDFSSLPPLDLPAPPAFAPAVAAPAFTVTPDDPFADLTAPPPQAAQDDVFDLGFSAPAPARPAPPAAAPAAEESLFVFEDVAPAPAPALAEDPDDLFGLGTGAIRQRYLQSLSSEGIFDFGEPAPAAPAPVPVMPAPAPVPYEPAPFEPLQHPVGFEAFAPAPAEEAPVFETPVYDETPAYEAPAFEPEPFDFGAAPPVYEPLPADLPTAGEEEEAPVLIPGESPFEAHAIVPEPVFAEPLPIPQEVFAAEEVEEVEEEAEPAATVTLGDLYLRQGHPREAERIFREVLDREPANTAARIGLEQAGQTAPRPLAAADLMEGFDPDETPGPNARMIHLLSSYLKRIRQGQRSRPHVS